MRGIRKISDMRTWLPFVFWYAQKRSFLSASLRIFHKDRHSVYVSCNESYARDLKIRPYEIAGKTDYDFFPKELADKYRADDKRLMASEKTVKVSNQP